MNLRGFYGYFMRFLVCFGIFLCEFIRKMGSIWLISTVKRENFWFCWCKGGIFYQIRWPGQKERSWIPFCVRACVCGMSGGHYWGTVEFTFLVYGMLKIWTANSLIWLTRLFFTSACCFSLPYFTRENIWSILERQVCGIFDCFITMSFVCSFLL